MTRATKPDRARSTRPIVAARRRRLVPQARPAASRSATRSCSSSTSAASSRRCSSLQALARPGRGARRVHPRGVASGSGSPCSSPTSPRRWPRAAARRRPTRSAQTRQDVAGQEARRSRERDAPARAGLRQRRCARATSCSSRPATSIPGDGEVVEGVASVDESAITGESAPVIRESGGDRSAVTGGTRVLSDWLVVRVTRQPRRDLPRPHDRDGRGREAAEDAERDRAQHPAGGAHDHLPARHRHAAAVLASTACSAAGQGTPVTVTVLVALLVCLIPTTIGGLLSAIGIAGMDRMIQANVIAMSGRAVEAAGDVDVLLLDKTGTITLGNRQATAFLPAAGRRASATSPTPRSSPRSPTRRPRAAASSCSPRRSTASASATCTTLGADVRPVHRADAHERRRPRRPADPQGRRRRGRGATSRRLGGQLPGAVRERGRRRSPSRAARRWSSPTARRCSASSS